MFNINGNTKKRVQVQEISPETALNLRMVLRPSRRASRGLVVLVGIHLLLPVPSDEPHSTSREKKSTGDSHDDRAQMKREPWVRVHAGGEKPSKNTPCRNP